MIKRNRQVDIIVFSNLQAEVYIVQAKQQAAAKNMGRCRRDADEQPDHSKKKAMYLDNADHFRVLHNQYMEESEALFSTLGVFAEQAGLK